MADFTPEQYEELRADFEKVFGEMPWGCTWIGSSYCPTSFSAWDAQRFDSQFKGFCAGRNPKHFKGIGRETKLADDPVALRKQAQSMLSLISSLEIQMSSLRTEKAKWQESVASLDSEREMNAILTKENEVLEMKLAQALKRN